AAQYRNGDPGREPGAGVVQHGRNVDAAVSVAAARLVDGRIRQLLHLLGIVRDDRLLGRRLDDRPLRPAPRFRHPAARSSPVHGDLDLRREQDRAVGPRLGMELGLYRRRGPVTTYTAEMYPTRIRGVGN